MMNDENKHTYDNGFHPREVKLKENYKFYNRTILFRFFSAIIVFFTIIFIVPIKRIFYGFRVKGKENLKGIKGAVTISNHILPLDAFFLVSTLYPKKTYITMLESNLGFPVFSQYIRLAAATPIPTNPKLFIKFLKETKATLENNNFVHIYPEAALIPYCDHIRPFLPGAFHIAYNSKVPIIPMVYTFHKRKGIFKFKKKPCITLNILKPYHIDETLPKKEAINKLNNDLFNIINDYFEKNNEVAYKK